MYLTHLHGILQIHPQNPSQHVPTILTKVLQPATIKNIVKVIITAHPPFSPVLGIMFVGLVSVLLCAFTILAIQNKRDVVMFTYFTMI